jgi:hypothetical protein
MNRLIVRGILFLFVVFSGHVPVSHAQACDFPPKGFAEGPRREYRGPYKNKAYGYSVVIPDNIVGYDDANPFYQHGFGMILGTQPKGYIFVNGEPNTLEFADAASAAVQSLQYLGKHGNKVESSRIADSQLGELKAALLVATYTCASSKERYTTASIVAISPDKSKLYEVTLYARSDRYEQDRVVLDALAKSWKYLPQ